MGIKFEFKNLGVLQQAAIELAPFTLVCGGNNCGKTYLAYAIYGLFRSWDAPQNLLNLRPCLDTLLKDGHCSIDMKSFFSIERLEQFEQQITGSYVKEQLGKSLAVPASRLQDTEMSISLKDREKDFFERSFANEIRKGKNSIIEVKKPANSYSVSIERTGEFSISDEREQIALLDVMNNSVTSLVKGILFPNTFMASCERTGAVIFRNELNLNKSRLLEAVGEVLAKGKQSINEFDILTTLFKGDYSLRYPTPVKDNVDFINQIPDIEKDSSYLAKEHPEIIAELDELVGGTFGIRDGNIVFMDGQKTSRRRASLNLQEVSSSVRSLVVLTYYLKCIAQKNDLLMIDEPELNLHPSNQRKMARLLARLVNAGLNVFVTTHSDVIAKEINTLLLMKKAGGDFAKKQGYQESELLESQNVELYISERIATAKKRNIMHVLKKMDKFDDGGLNFKLFDKTIQEMNDVQDSVWAHLMEKGE